MGDLPLLGTNAQIIRIVEALFGVQPGNLYYTNFQDFVAETSLDALSNALVVALAPTDAESLAATVAANYQVDADLETEDGLNVINLLETYITAQLNTVPEIQWGAKILEITNQYTNLWTDPLLGESVVAFNDAVVASLVYSANSANPDVNDPDGTEPVDPPAVDGEGLTLAQDNIVGTDADEIFSAFIFNNSNTLQSGDMVDGAGGMDTLFADIGNSQSFAITPHTNSVEKLQVRAQAVSSDSNENNMHNGVQIDAERMVGTTWYESNNSRADVTIEDVRILRSEAYGDDSDQITENITVAMVSTDPGNVDLGVYFDQHSLVNEGDSQSNSITLTVGNQLEVENGFDSATPLADIPYTLVGFLVNEEQVVLPLDLENVETYEDMWGVVEAAFNAEKDTNPLLSNVDIERSIGTDTFFSRDGELRSADEYLLTIEVGEITPSNPGWVAEGGLPPSNAFSATVLQGDVTVTSNLITSNIILDDVGRGSMGGDLIVGGMSIGQPNGLDDEDQGVSGPEGTSDSKGVEQFNIIVERSSKLQEIQSTNNTLEEVYIVNGDTNGDLVVAGDTNLGLTADQDDLPGSDDNAAGFRDVRVLDASAMVGKVDINAALTEAVVDKYLDLKDDTTNAASDNVGFEYDLGTNDDALSLNISAENLEAAGTTTREDFYLNVNGNAGDDMIMTMVGDGTGTDADNWYRNSQENANLTVNGNAGDDTIKTVGAGDFFINAGTGNDTVYANNDGVQTIDTVVQADVDALQVIADASQVTADATQVTANATQVTATASQATADASQVTADASQATADVSAALVVTVTADVALLTTDISNVIFDTDNATTLALFAAILDAAELAGTISVADNAAILADIDAAPNMVDQATTDAAAVAGNLVVATDNNIDEATTAADADQVTADADQATADADQATADADQATADADQADADADQADATADATAVVNAQAAVDAGYLGADDVMATWVINAANTEITDLDSAGVSPAALLVGAQLTVTLSNAGAVAAGRITDADAVANENGFESTVTVGNISSLANEAQVNQAIKNAINNDAVLNKLLVAEDGPANTLVITSLVDGEFKVDDLAIDIAAPATLSTSQLTAAQSAMEALANNSNLDPSSADVDAAIAVTAAALTPNFTLATASGFDMTGAESESVSDNTIDLGSGDDVAVLGTDATSNDTLVFEGIFGNDSIFNFVNAAGNTGLDMLDFTAYLTNDISTSGSATSAVRIGTSADGDATLTANEVDTFDFTQNIAGDANETWANLTASDLLAAIQASNTGDDNYGNITDGSYDVTTVADLVGNVQNGIIMVENDLNAGEYKVFSTFADDTTEEFTAVTLVGTIDFGNTIDATVIGSLV